MSKPLTIFQAYKKYGWPAPGSKVKSVEIMLGEQCNAKCFFCCSWGGIGKWLDIEEVKNMIDLASKKGCWLVSFSGGEALLYPRILDAISYCKKMKIPMIQIVSNGILLSDKKFAFLLKDAGLNEVKLSLHSVSPKKHDLIVGVNGAFEKINKAIETLNDLEIKVSCNFAIMRCNYKELPLFVKYMNEKGLSGFCFMFSFFSGKFIDSPQSVSYAQVKNYITIALEYMKLKKIRAETAMLNNFVPCVLPGYENLMADWGNIKKKSMVGMSGNIKNGKEIYYGRKIILSSCKKCIYGRICYGIDRGYLEKFGDSEFKPLKSIPVKRMEDPLYI